MSRIYQDSFDSYGTGITGQTNPPWSAQRTPATGSARTGTYGFPLGANAPTLRLASGPGALAGPYTELYVGFFIKVTGTVVADTSFLAFTEGDNAGWDAATPIHVTITLSGDTTNNKWTDLKAWRGNKSVQLGSTATFSYPNGYGGIYLEVYVKIDDTVGRVVVKAEGVTVVDFTGDTKNGGTGTLYQVGFGHTAGSNNAGMDDLYINDSAGAVNNGFSGDQRIYLVMSSGVGNYAAFTPSAGANWQNVDEVGDDADTTYNDSSNPTDKDSFAFADVSPAPALNSVSAVQWRAIAKRADASASAFKRLFRRSATDYKGSNLTLGDAYLMYLEMFETNPDTAAAWTVANFNDSEWGYEAV